MNRKKLQFTLALLIGFSSFQTLAVSIDDGLAVGGVAWSYVIPSSAVSASAGEFGFNPTYFESNSPINMSIGDADSLILQELCGISNMQWSVSAYVDSPAIEGYEIEVKKISGAASIYGGTTYTKLSSTPTVLFCGTGNVSFAMQYRVKNFNINSGWGQNVRSVHYTVAGTI